MKESQDFFTDETLPPCPYCGETANERDELGRIRWDAVVVEKRVKRRAWAELYPEDDRWFTAWKVKCTACGASGGARESREAAVLAWSARIVPGMSDAERETARRAATGAIAEEIARDVLIV